MPDSKEASALLHHAYEQLPMELFIKIVSFTFNVAEEVKLEKLESTIRYLGAKGETSGKLPCEDPTPLRSSRNPSEI